MREKRDKAALPQAIRSVTYLKYAPSRLSYGALLLPIFDAFLHLDVI